MCIRDRIDTWGRKQAQQNSGVLPASDYSDFRPLNKKPVDMNNFNHKRDEMNPSKAKSDLTQQEQRKQVSYNEAKQA